MGTPARPVAAACLILLLPITAFLIGRPRPLPRADFTFVMPKENSTLDPAQATSVSDGWIIQALFEGLTRLDPVTLEVLPATAERHEVSADGLVHTFHLRRDARWSDGRPVTADDFVFAWRRTLDPALGCVFAELLQPVEGAAEILAGMRPAREAGLAATDPHTFVVRLIQPCSYLTALAAHFSLSPLRSDQVGEHGSSFTAPGRLVSNGPYRLALRRIRDRIRLVRNEQYHRAEDVALGVIDALAIDSPTTAMNLFLAGEVDWVNALPSAAIPYLRGRDELRLNTVLATRILRFNVTVDALADPRVRRAIDLALDRDALSRHVYRSGERPATSYVPPELPGYTPPARPQAEIEEARRLLADAGYPGGLGLAELELLHPADESRRAVAEAISLTLRESLGIRLRPMPQEFKVYIDSQNTLRYQICLGIWVGDYLDPSTFLDVFRAGSGTNRTGWKEPRYDALLDQAAASVDQEERFRLLAEAERLLLAEGPIAPICFAGQPNLVSSRVEGFTTNPLDLHPLDRLRIRP